MSRLKHNTANKTKKDASDRCIGFNVSMSIGDFMILERRAQIEEISRSELIRRAMQLYYDQHQHQTTKQQ